MHYTECQILLQSADVSSPLGFESTPPPPPPAPFTTVMAADIIQKDALTGAAAALHGY